LNVLSTAAMGQCCSTCQVTGSPGQEGRAAEQEEHSATGLEQKKEQEVTLLSSVWLNPSETDDCYMKAYEALKLSIDEDRSMASTAAFAALADAEMWLSKGKPPVPSDLQIAFETDPEIIQVKKKLQSMDECLAKSAEATAEQRKEAMARVSVHVLDETVQDKESVIQKTLTEMSDRVSETRTDANIDHEGAVNRLGLTRKRPSVTSANTDLMQNQTSLASGGERKMNPRPSVRIAEEELSFQRIKNLCSEVQVFAAVEELKALELDVATTYELAKAVERMEVMDQAVALSQQLNTDPVLQKLRSVHSRFEEITNPQGLLSQAMTGENWVTGELKDADLGEHFRMEVAMRLAEAAERDKDGPATQLIAKVTMSGWPQPASNFLALERETDLFQKEFMADCKFSTGIPGELDQLMSCMGHLQVRPALLPINFEYVFFREFAVCPSGLLPGLSSGALEIESNLPLNKSEFEGWKIPPAKFGNVRSESKQIKHIAPTEGHPELTTITIFSKDGIPLPGWMLPLKFLMKLAIDLCLKTFKRIKEKVVDKWEELPYSDRTKASRKLYDALAGINA